MLLLSLTANRLQVRKDRRFRATDFLTLVIALSHAVACVHAQAYVAEFRTYVGGSADDQIRGVAVDSQGNMILTGGTASSDFPTTPGAHDQSFNGTYDVFVTKLSPRGALIWSTYVGGPNYDRAYAVDVDAKDNIYIAGRAGPGFPTMAGVLQQSFGGDTNQNSAYGPQDGFVCKLTSAGTVTFCTYFGGSDLGFNRDLRLDPSGNIYLASSHLGGTYPAAVGKAFLNSPFGGEDNVIAKLKNDGTQVVWARFVGGAGTEPGTGSVRTDGNGNAYLLFSTDSSGIATAGAFDTTYGGGGGDFYVAKFSAAGAVLWGTYLGGSDNESTETHEFAVDMAGNVYVVGPTKSSDFPTTPGAFDRSFNGPAGGNDMVVAKSSSDGSRLLASTYIGGNGNDRSEGCAVDSQGNVYFTGTTTSTNFPITAGASQTSLAGGRDAVAAVLAADFTSLIYSTHLGGRDVEFGRAAAVDPSGNFFLAGTTVSKDFPILNPFQGTYGGGIGDGWAVKLNIKETADTTPSARLPAQAAQRHAVE